MLKAKQTQSIFTKHNYSNPAKQMQPYISLTDKKIKYWGKTKSGKAKSNTMSNTKQIE